VKRTLTTTIKSFVLPTEPWARLYEKKRRIEKGAAESGVALRVTHEKGGPLRNGRKEAACVGQDEISIETIGPLRRRVVEEEERYPNEKKELFAVGAVGR